MKTILLLLIPILGFTQIPIDTTHVTHVPIHPFKKLDKEPVTCLVGESESLFYSDPGQVTIPELSSNCIGIYVETDSFTYASFGYDMNSVVTWIEDLVEQAKATYLAEGINIYLESYYVATTREWADDLSTSEILYAFGGVRGDTIKGRIKHFITRRGLGGGIAWVNALDVNVVPVFSGGEIIGYFGPYAVSANMTAVTQPYPTWGWNVQVFVHEMGHVIGSRHTQDCVWGPTSNMKIDDCVSGGACDLIIPVEYSTIMSYCHLTSHGIDLANGFGELPGNLIRAMVEGSSLSYPAELTLTGDISGIHRAKKIILDNATNTGDITLSANEIDINVTQLYPIFVTKTLGCN